MTLGQFMTRLTEVSKTRKFRIRNYNELRYRGRCPIEVVAGTNKDTAGAAIRKLGLSQSTAFKIMNAADMLGHYYRKALLKATGLA